jgi:hypothetical protein
MRDPLDTIIRDTLTAHAELTNMLANPANNVSPLPKLPWDIEAAGAKHLAGHGSALRAIVDAGAKVLGSPSGSSIVTSVSSSPTDPANTGKILKNGIFKDALNAVKADRLLRTVFIGWSTGTQVGLAGGGGGTGVAYDIIDFSNRAAIIFGSFDIGIGGNIGAGLLLGAMTAEPHHLNHQTCVWKFGVSMMVGVIVMVIMKNSDLSLVGFGLQSSGRRRRVVHYRIRQHSNALGLLSP